MGDCELLCNVRKCRKRLEGIAWVTSCSHIFCEEDVNRAFQKSRNCPACDMNLTNKYDLLKVDLHPSEQFKSMWLAGQKPDTIIDVCSRALSFWTYQTHQELLYQEHVSSRCRERISQLEQCCEQIVARMQSEISSLKTQLTASKKDVENAKRHLNEVTDKLTEKTRQYQKLQGLYDSLRRKSLSLTRHDHDGELTATFLASPHVGMSSMHILDTGEDLLRRSVQANENTSGTNRPVDKLIPTKDADFVLQPHLTPVIGWSSCVPAGQPVTSGRRSTRPGSK